MGDAETVVAVVLEEAAAAGVPAEVQLTVMRQEAGLRHLRGRRAILGAKGEIGACQILPATARWLGFQVRDMQDLRLNLRACARRLAVARDRCGGPVVRWVGNFNGRACGPRNAYSVKIAQRFACADLYLKKGKRCSPRKT